MRTRIYKAIQSQWLVFMALMLLTGVAEAASFGGNTGTGGNVFKPFYDFIYAAATGYLGRSLAITGGLIGFGLGAFTGKPILALSGVILALFGVFGPVIADSFFTSALI